MQNALSLLTRTINRAGGIRLSQTDSRPLQIVNVDDGGQPDNVKAVTTALLDGSVTGRPVDFVLGPYLSTLNEQAARVADARGVLFMSAGASATSVFVNRSLSFGMLSPASTYLQSGVELLHAKGVRSIALLVEYDDSASVQYCAGAQATAEGLGILIAVSARVTVKLNRTRVSSALDQFRASNPDAVVGCTKYDNCAEFLAQAAADPGFYVRAMLFTLCATDPKFKDLPKLQTAYVLGVTPWSEQDNKTDDLLGWSPASFAAKYEGIFGQTPPYQAVATFAGGLLLANAIEASGSLEPKLVAAQLARARMRTVFGDVLFNADRQNIVPFITLQAMPSRQQLVVTARTAIFPMPSWKKRHCEVTDRCVGMGGCLEDGNCTHPPCPMGSRTLNDTRGQPGCESCAPGSFSVSGTVEVCTPCPAGTLRLWRPD
jgi:ABC-type branched-subunit amino acid transport system substrate-binding protein